MDVLKDIEEAEIVENVSITVYIGDNTSPHTVSFPLEKFEEESLKGSDLKCLIISELHEHLSNEEPTIFSLSGIESGSGNEKNIEDNVECSSYMIEYIFSGGFRLREKNT
ncbi:hypothetical protein BgiMline_031752 [Biomphalaria glabrata]|nr:hypothetical protein BgiMline_019958 [Biomphalaria glabrata]KAI8780233.1 hypothetical protein BgiBS90_019427 [Biomphalaria glabrata]